MNKSFLECKKQRYRGKQIENINNFFKYRRVFCFVSFFLFICTVLLINNRQSSIGQNEFFVRVVEANGYSVLIRRDSIFKVTKELSFHIQCEQLEKHGFSLIKKNYLVEVNGKKQPLKYTDVITVKPDDQIKSLVFYQINSLGYFNLHVNKQEFKLE